MAKAKKYEEDGYSIYTVRMPKEEKERLQKKIKILAAEKGMSVWLVIDEAVENYRLKGEKR